MIVNKNQIALVNDNDIVIGYDDKLEVHKKGLLHRAFSVFIINNKNEMMLQRRSFQKYHSGGLWTNACCSHMLLGEEFAESIHSRLHEEMGFDCELEHVFNFRYKTTFDNGLTENELDHVYIGQFCGEPIPNKDEVCDWKWMRFEDITNDLVANEELYTVWFKIAFEKLKPFIKSSTYQFSNY